MVTASGNIATPNEITRPLAAADEASILKPLSAILSLRPSRRLFSWKIMTERPEHNSAYLTAGLKTAVIDGFRLKWKDDGFDYPGLWLAFRRGEKKGEVISDTGRHKSAWRLQADGRLFLVKRDEHQEKRLEKRLAYLLLKGARYSRMIKLINRAVAQGCRDAQEVFFVAEKMEGGICREAWLLADFKPGRSLSADEAKNARAELLALMGRIHHYGLASNDIQPYNFIRTDQGRLMLIDLDVSGPIIVCQANDVLMMEYKFGYKPDLSGRPGLRLVTGLLLWRNRLRAVSRFFRGKPDKLLGTHQSKGGPKEPPRLPPEQ